MSKTRRSDSASGPAGPGAVSVKTPWPTTCWPAPEGLALVAQFNSQRTPGCLPTLKIRFCSLLACRRRHRRAPCSPSRTGSAQPSNLASESILPSGRCQQVFCFFQPCFREVLPNFHPGFGVRPRKERGEPYAVRHDRARGFFKNFFAPLPPGPQPLAQSLAMPRPGQPATPRAVRRSDPDRTERNRPTQAWPAPLDCPAAPL